MLSKSSFIGAWSKLAAPGRRGFLEITGLHERFSRFQGLSKSSISLPVWDLNSQRRHTIRRGSPLKAINDMKQSPTCIKNYNL